MKYLVLSLAFTLLAQWSTRVKRNGTIEVTSHLQGYALISLQVKIPCPRSRKLPTLEADSENNYLCVPIRTSTLYRRLSCLLDPMVLVNKQFDWIRLCANIFEI